MSVAAGVLSEGPRALAEWDTKALISKAYPRANTRALISAAMAGSALGLGLAFAYLAGANSVSGLMHARARELTSAEANGFTDVALQHANGLAPGALAIAQRHDPFTISGAEQRDRQSADFAARLEQSDPAPLGVTAASLMLRPELGPDGGSLAGRFRFASIGALDGARDLDCLTQAVYYESRGESPRGQAAVAQVVLNRVKHPAFPKTICAVVFQGAGLGRADCQFSFVCDGSMRQPLDRDAWDKSQHVAARALSGAVIAEIGGATHFHATRLGPQWGDGLIKVATVGLHVFYKFGHKHPDFQAQVIEASNSKPPGIDVKPVLAALIPTAQAAEPPRAEVKPASAEPAKEVPAAAVVTPVAAATPVKPVAQTKAEAPAA
jgi:spore germination cell wall hydrolase CwlJ-like protein